MADTPWNTALNLLARREYSRAELARKLEQRFPDQPESIADVLERLSEQGLQDDQRFAEAFFRSQLGRNRGPNRMRHEARQKGIGEAIEAELATADVDWFDLALDAARRKLGRDDPADVKVQARLSRFLAYRGFDGDCIGRVLSQLRSSGATDEFESFD
ncbi:regulatory protein RecX [Saccharospirillum mangrovi]|uniref:regulatory protein RecX n=1 Tax=Saccharospirillum mangrovi TaxID=2161747 RepID=UPI000D33CBC6|nr:regulatory protein RecX [Saccharospirillum mangrovi]